MSDRARVTIRTVVGREHLQEKQPMRKPKKIRRHKQVTVKFAPCAHFGRRAAAQRSKVMRLRRASGSCGFLQDSALKGK
jgi:hypothetical protein